MKGREGLHPASVCVKIKGHFGELKTLLLVSMFVFNINTFINSCNVLYIKIIITHAD
jgi:hypothetical protein